MLLPMSFSLGMRELMVWATDSVLPVLSGGGSGGVGDGGKYDMGPPEGWTPGE